MVQKILRFKNKHPFLFIMAIGIMLRMIATLFSKGFGMHDDHFLVIEQAQSWADGIDYDKWLPWTAGNTGPQGHSFFYVGFNYLVLKTLTVFGLHDPQWKMYIVRFLHAMLSLLVISFGYRIASLIAERKTAYRVALLLAVFWFMPFLSVRNLVEMVCIPFLMYGTLIVLRQELIRKQNDPGYHQTSFLVAGFFLGLAFSVRYQTIFYTGGLGLAILIAGNWRGMVSTALGFLASITIFQGVIDLLVWRMPFAELIQYVNYNYNHAYEYIINPWYNYLLVIVGVLIPPVSLMIFWGYLKEWKKNFLLFLPITVFLIFHSFFPNKQERFILPVIPMLIVLGYVGWDKFRLASVFWQKHPRFHTGLWAFFWLINIGLLLAVTPMYSKKSRVESMSYLGKYPDINYFVVEDIGNEVLRYPPVYYTGQWPRFDAITKNVSYAKLAKEKNWEILENQPKFVLFYQENQLQTRVDSMMKYLPQLEYETKTVPSIMDRIIHRINPINANEKITIYRNKALIP
jgi:hypothetical protein